MAIPQKNEAPQTRPAQRVRKPRDDGLKSRRAILDAAARLATTQGLEELSIGELAQHIGMSKSGLYAHFKSKEELELATIDAAAEIFEFDVIRRVPEALRGTARITTLSEAFLQHLARRVFPAGCFFATVAAQLAPRPGRARDRVLRFQGEWIAQFVAALRQSRDDGEIQPAADLDQVAFEITAMLFRANFGWIMSGDERVLDQARVGIRGVLSRAAKESATKGRIQKKNPRRGDSRHAG